MGSDVICCGEFGTKDLTSRDFAVCLTAMNGGRIIVGEPLHYQDLNEKTSSRVMIRLGDRQGQRQTRDHGVTPDIPGT